MNDMVLAPVWRVGLWGAASALEPAAKTGELTADAARTPAVPASMSRRDTVERHASEASFMLMLQEIEKRDQIPQANDATVDGHSLHYLRAPARALRLTARPIDAAAPLISNAVVTRIAIAMPHEVTRPPRSARERAPHE